MLSCAAADTARIVAEVAAVAETVGGRGASLTEIFGGDVTAAVGFIN